MSTSLSTPVLLAGYNRPDSIRRVMESLAAVRPSLLFAALDGPNPSRPDDRQLCAEVQRVVREGVTWPCDLRMLCREENLGCGPGMVSAITWFFEHVEAGIILEDDILAGPDFFRFCSDLLLRYRDDERVWSITGVNFQDGQVRGDGSYYFSKYVGSWGWAGWRRTWRFYEHAFPDLDGLEDADWWQAVHADPVEALYWRRQFRDAETGRASAWDYQWQCKCWQHGGMIAKPNVNLTKNIGYGPDATHTKEAGAIFSQKTIGLLGELRHPSEVRKCAEADEYVFTHHYCPPGSESERLVWDALIRQQSRQIKQLKKALAESEKHSRGLEKEFSWGAAHRWKAARRLLAGKWPETKS